MSVTKLTDKNFERETSGCGIPILIDFYATWCAPCRKLSPIIEEIASEQSSKWKIFSVNVDENPKLSEMFGIQYMPTLVVMSGGKVKCAEAGYRPKADVLKLMGID